MNLFLLNLVLALTWCVLNSSFQLADLVIGMLFGATVIGLAQRALGQRPGYLHALWTLLGFLWFAIYEIVLANIALARVLLRRNLQLRPEVVAIPLKPQGAGATTVLANLITLTPGTLTLDLAPDARTIYVHNLVLDDKEAFVNQVKDYEQRVLAVFRELGEQNNPEERT
jgi:multicomponent Na+:H+ antiporter subunit E